MNTKLNAARSFDFEITSIISAQIALHSVQLQIYNDDKFVCFSDLSFNKLTHIYKGTVEGLTDQFNNL